MNALMKGRFNMKRKYIGLLAIVGLAAFLFGPSPAFAQIPPLGTAKNFAVLAGTTVTNTGPTSITTGDVGVHPGTAIVGFPPGVIVAGVKHSADAVALQAQNDLITAYDAVAGAAGCVDMTGVDLGGQVLTPGVYCFTGGAFLTGTLTLNLQGDPAAVFLFKTVSTLITTVGSSVVLINTGGTACPENVFWKVGSSATIEVGSTFVGNILALTDISIKTGATLTGRALARNGQVSLDNNTVTICLAGLPPPTATLTLRKTWAVNSIAGNTATVTSSGFVNNASSGLSTATVAGNTTTGVSVAVSAGETGTISEVFGVGVAANYNKTLTCTGNANALVGNSLTVNADEDIVCTETNVIAVFIPPPPPPPPGGVANGPTLDSFGLAILLALLAVAGVFAVNRFTS